MKAKQAQVFANFDFDPDVTAKWTKMVEDWDKDHSQPDPYEEPKSGTYFYDRFCVELTNFLDVTMADVHLELAREESNMVYNSMETGWSPLQFIQAGLALEEEQ
jgi:hypothetical protein